MSNVQRIFLALLGLVAATGVGVLLLRTAGGQDPQGAGGLQLEHSRATDSPRGEGVGETPLAALEGRRSAAGASGAIVAVRTVNDLGRRIPHAEIRLTNQDGQEWSGVEVARFEDVPAGSWTLEVTSRGMLTHTQAIEVIEGERHNYTVKLRKFLPITGRVLNRFGEPFGPTIVWFLHPGESHPMQRPGARKLREAQVSASGEFEIELNRGGEYRLSVGLIGKPLATMSEPRALHPGASRVVEIVVSGGTRLEIQLEDASPGLAAGKANFRVAILGYTSRGPSDGYRRPFKASSGTRRTGPRRGKRGAQSDDETADAGGGDRHAERGAQRETPRGGKPRPADQDPGPDPGQTAADPSLGGSAPGSGRGEIIWVERRTLAVPRTGKLVFDGLPAGQELKLAFLRRNERHESTTTLVLQEDRRMLVRFRVPGRLPKGEAGEVQEF